MNIKKILLVIFVLASIAQLAAPIQMISDREKAVREGTEFKFQCRPRDPYNPFKGRYVYLNFDAENYNGDFWAQNDGYVTCQAYAVIDTDKNGYAKILALHKERPANAKNYILVQVRKYESSRNVNIKLPFTEYYMEEHKAPHAEAAYWKNSSKTYATVRVLDGVAVMTGLYINNMPVEKFIDETPKKKKR